MLAVFSGAVGAAYQIVSALAQLLAPAAGSLATAAAIVGFTMAVRLVLLPLSYLGIRGQARQARVAAQAQALRERHARQPGRLQAELAQLYQHERASLVTGCLPVLAQLPFLSVMYTLIRSAAVDGHRNALLGHDLLTAPLGSHWLSGPGPFSAQGAVFGCVLALLAARSWLSARAARRSAGQQLPALAPARPGGAPVPPGREQDSPRRGQAAAGRERPGGMAAALTAVLPYTTLVVAAFLPLAADLYLLTTTAWSAAERAVLARRTVLARAGAARAGGARDARA